MRSRWDHWERIEGWVQRWRGSDAAQGLIPRTRLAGPIPSVIAVMIALSVMAAAAALSLSNLAHNAQAEISGGVTVQIVEADPTARERQARLALTLLGGVPRMYELRRVPDAELNALLEPWLGKDFATDSTIPVPALIDVRLKGQVTAADLANLRKVLAKKVPAARVDAQSTWLGPVFDAVNSLRWLAMGLIMLIGMTSIAAVWLAARSAMAANRATIEIVYMLGASDHQIARIFQRSAARDAALGAVIGMAVGLGAIAILARQFAALGSGMVQSAWLTGGDWVAIGAIPFIGVAVAFLTARITVLSALRRML
ncbi:cell division protein [Altererythrobacter indicus]|uniref:Cell division protein n=1 Tax=Altericroceibacterium indicum TaxID=374177 RepID=A0A845A9N8_9SPHN|nr:FtsX-like permease family protein [Altericroceibacterium indicum]MXP26227.1 cell division protein [Altericroceibacterium indicum]